MPEQPHRPEARSSSLGGWLRRLAQRLSTRRAAASGTFVDPQKPHQRDGKRASSGGSRAHRDVDGGRDAGAGRKRLPQPGEVVWAYVPFEDDPSQGKDRPVLVLDTDGDRIVALPMTSKDHDRDAAQEERAGRHWMDVGAGDWDAQHRPSEVRLDRVVRLEAEALRRDGATLDPALFARVQAAHREAMH